MMAISPPPLRVTKDRAEFIARQFAGIDIGWLTLAVFAGMGSFHNTGDEEMRLFWVIFPAGLEDWFAAIGRPRTPGETEAPVFDRPSDVKDIQDRMNFVRPEDAEGRPAR